MRELRLGSDHHRGKLDQLAATGVFHTRATQNRQVVSAGGRNWTAQFAIREQPVEAVAALHDGYRVAGRASVHASAPECGEPYAQTELGPTNLSIKPSLD
jgi:hypothetical protein